MFDINGLFIGFAHALGAAAEQADILGVIDKAMDYVPQNLPEIYNQSVQTLQHYLDKANLGYIKAEILSPLIIFIMTRQAAYAIVKFVFVIILITNLAKILKTV